MSLDHIGFNASDFPRSREFYLAALAPLGLAPVGQAETWVMLGRNGRGAFWLGGYGLPPTPAIHLAFAAPDRAAVRAFHAAALATGASDNGGPGLRDYHPDYYAAYVLDPDGNNVEAVCHAPEP